MFCRAMRGLCQFFFDASDQPNMPIDLQIPMRGKYLAKVPGRFSLGTQPFGHKLFYK